MAGHDAHDPAAISSSNAQPRPPPVAAASSWSPGTSFQRRRIKLFSGTEVGPWKKGQIIGKGANGAVYEAVDEPTGGYFAVKEVEFDEDFADNPEGRKRFEALRAEVALLQMLDHPNVVRFLGVDRVGFSMYIMMEFVAGGSIHSLVKRFGRLPEELTVKYTAQLVRGLRYLHEKAIIHRDIKGANVLVSDDGTVKLADFGAAKRVLDPEQLQHTLAGTPYWMAPEVVKQHGHGKPADVWSVGATVLQMLTGQAPYQALAPVPALFKIGHGTDSPIPADAPLSALARDFVDKCLTRDVAKRPTVEQLAFHPWLASASPRPSVPASLDGSAVHGHPESPGGLRGGNSTVASTGFDDGAAPTAHEMEVMDYLIALSFHHDDSAAEEAMAARHAGPSSAGGGDPDTAQAHQHVVGAVTFDAALEVPDDDDDTSPAFDDAQFDAFVQNLAAQPSAAAESNR